MFLIYYIQYTNKNNKINCFDKSCAYFINFYKPIMNYNKHGCDNVILPQLTRCGDYNALVWHVESTEKDHNTK